jgi:hypothetical protein
MTKSGGELSQGAKKAVAVVVILLIFFLFFMPWLSALVQSKGRVLNWATDRAWRVNWDWIDSIVTPEAFLARQTVWKASAEHKDSYPAASAFADKDLEKSVAPGLSQRFDIGRSDTGDFGTTLNARSASNRQAPPSAFSGSRSGLTGSREAPYFPEGSMYNIEGKLRDGALATGAEGFRRSRFDPEQQLHG